MTLLITALAAMVVGGTRLARPGFGHRHKLGVLALIYAGAALMWCVDAVGSLLRGEPLMATTVAGRQSDALLGALVVVLGLVAWAVYRLITARRGNATRTRASNDVR